MVVDGISEGIVGKEAWYERRRVEARRSGVTAYAAALQQVGMQDWGGRSPARILCQYVRRNVCVWEEWGKEVETLCHKYLANFREDWNKSEILLISGSISIES